MDSPSASFEEILDDLEPRFITNLPYRELNSPERLGMHIQKAYWFYQDHYRKHYPRLEDMHLKLFSEKILYKHCGTLSPWAEFYDQAYDRFVKYRNNIRVCGAIMLNPALNKCLLVKGGGKKPCWGFPKGKINENENPDNCAIREVLEETGYDISPLLRRNECLVEFKSPMLLYIITGVPEDTIFVAQSNKEIKGHAWTLLTDLKDNGEEFYEVESKTYRMVAPFMKQLNEFVNQRRNGPI